MPPDEFGFSTSTLRVLRHISIHGPTTAKALADHVGWSYTTAQKHINRLIKARLLKRDSYHGPAYSRLGLVRDMGDDDHLRTALMTPVTPAHFAMATSEDNWLYPKHLQYMNAYLTDFLTDPDERFLLIEASVRHGKSRFVTGDCVAWFMGTYPEKNVFIASYSQRLVTGWSRYARDKMMHYGPEMFGNDVRADVSSASHWQLKKGGGQVIATTTRGQITGLGGDLIIVDDPIKNLEVAMNATERQKVWDFYNGTLASRLAPGGKVIVICARWHADDLVGRLKEASIIDPKAPQWEEMNMPAIAMKPAGAGDDWRDEIGRADGDALWPELWPKHRLESRMRTVGPYIWNAQYQQSPINIGSEVLARALWATVDVAPAGKPIVRRWDLAASGADGDRCAGVLMTTDDNGFTYIVDIVYGSYNALQAKQVVRVTAEADFAKYGQLLTTRIEQEPGSSGKAMAEDMIRNTLAGFKADAKPSTGSKGRYVTPFAAQQQAGNVRLVRSVAEQNGQVFYVAAKWWEPFMAECEVWPRGTFDDMLDAASKAYEDLRGSKPLSGPVRVSTNRRKRVPKIKI